MAAIFTVTAVRTSSHIRLALFITGTVKREAMEDAVEWLEFLLRTLEVLGSKSGLTTGFQDFSERPQSL
jgi:hypothetical protein